MPRAAGTQCLNTRNKETGAALWRQGRINNVNLAPWHALQQFLALGPADVVIPFAGQLADLIPPIAVRLRRDYPTILALIEAHALLHQASRERSAQDAVIATFADYSAVRELVADLISQGVGKTVPDSIRETINAVDQLKGADEGVVSVAVLAKELGLDKSSASRRAKDAIKRGYLNNLEDKRGRPARLVLGDPLPDDVEVLPTPENLKAKYCTLAASTVGHSTAPSPSAVLKEEAAWTF